MNTAGMVRRWRLILILAAAAALMVVLFGGVAQATSFGGAVYTQTNDSTSNQVLVFHRAPNGALSDPVAYDTGGIGAPFGPAPAGADIAFPQGAVALSENGHWLFAVNAGSSDISVFAVWPWGLRLVDREPCSGTTPVSLTVHGGLLYILEAGAPGVPDGNIEGFRIGLFGRLHPIAGSVQPLSGDAIYPVQIGFSPRGNLLVVTELDVDKIDTYAVNFRGVAAPPVVHDSSGGGPYGFAFDKWGRLLVSEASGYLSSYAATAHGFNIIDGSVSNEGYGSPCWVALTDNGKYAYTGNGGDGSISSYRVSYRGELSLLSGRAAQPGGVILDLAVADNSYFRYSSSSFLYALDPNGVIDIFKVAADGSLTDAGSVNAPAGVNGLAAR
jgi:6-phosphogluconolactonase (cycloisomerase 2 family)